MTVDRAERIARLIEALLECPLDQRTGFLKALSVLDEGLRSQVENGSTERHQPAQAPTADRDADPSQVPTGSLEHLSSPAGDEFRASVSRGRKVIQRAGPYELLHQIGAGGMGAVYVAVRRGEDFRQRVAVKLMRRDTTSDDLVRRFRTERQILAAMEHPNVARLLDGGTADDGRLFFAMEYIEGQRIDEYCDVQRLSVRERLKLFRSVCSAVQFAHQNLVVHRDIKPGNILVTADGVPKLLDFGIAKLLSPLVASATLDPTLTGLRMMTPEYASPEQVRGHPITTASDIYSLGVLLYKLLTGHWPYHVKGGQFHEISRAICEQEPIRPSLSVAQDETKSTAGGVSERASPESVSLARSSSAEKLQKELAGDLDTIVLQALRKEPNRRYASAEQLSEDIWRYLEGLPVMARRGSTAYRAAKFIRRHRIGVAMTVASFVALVIFGVSMVAQTNRVIAERDRAEAAQRRAETVSLFLEDALGAANPYSGLGRDVTVVEMLDGASAEISRSFADMPETRASLQASVGNTYMRLGRFDDAEAMLRASLATRRELHGGEDSPELAGSMNFLANLLRRRAEYDEAEILYREALAMQIRLHGDRHPEVATILNNLGAVRDRQSDYDGAEDYYRRSLAMRRATLGSRHPDVAESQNALANLLRRKGAYEESEQLYLSALALRRDLHGENHPDVAESLNNLAFLYYTTKDFERAEPLFRKSLELRRSSLGEKHPETASSMTNLARLLRSTGHLDEAEQLYLEVLTVRREVLGERHPDVATTLNDLATLYSSKGDLAAAEPLYRQSLAMRRELLGDEHWYVAMSLNNLAVLLNRTGRHAEAEPMYRESLQLMRRLRGEDHPDVATAMTNLAGVLMMTGRYAEAEELQLAALGIRLEAFGETHPETVKSYRLLASFYEARGDRRQAEAYKSHLPEPP